MRLRLRRLRQRLVLAYFEWVYGRVTLNADFIYHPMRYGDPDPLFNFWSLGWKFSLKKGGRAYDQYGAFITGTELVQFDSLLHTLYSVELTQALNVAYQLGREDSNIVLRLWRRRKRKSIRNARLRNGINQDWDGTDLYLALAS